MIPQFIKNNSAQAGGIATFIIGVFIIGFFYIVFSQMMDQFNIANTQVMNSGVAYSQDHWDATNNLNLYWVGVPAFTILIYIVFAIKNALSRDPTEI